MLPESHSVGLNQVIADCSVHCFKATGVSIGGSRVVRAEEGNWVDVGKQHISLAVIVPEPSSGADLEDPPPDLLDIYYSKQTCNQCTHTYPTPCQSFLSFSKGVIGKQSQVLFPAEHTCWITDCITRY